jgi:uroporphyrinogen-III synthase
VVLFASPSAVEQFDRLFTAEEKGVFAPGTVVAVIGPTTDEAARKCGLSVHVRAVESTERGLLDALLRYREARMHTV